MDYTDGKVMEVPMGLPSSNKFTADDGWQKVGHFATSRRCAAWYFIENDFSSSENFTTRRLATKELDCPNFRMSSTWHAELPALGTFRETRFEMEGFFRDS